MAVLSNLAVDERVALADQLRAQRAATAEAVTEEFLRRHPDWLARYGEMAHIFLARAVESGASQGFADHARWAAGLLAVRGIAPHFLAQ